MFLNKIVNTEKKNNSDERSHFLFPVVEMTKEVLFWKEAKWTFVKSYKLVHILKNDYFFIDVPLTVV